MALGIEELRGVPAAVVDSGWMLLFLVEEENDCPMACQLGVSSQLFGGPLTSEDHPMVDSYALCFIDRYKLL